MKDKILLKDLLINSDKIIYLANLIKSKKADFDARNFTKEILGELNKLELKQRITFITEKIEKYLPNDYRENIDLFFKILEDTTESTDFIFNPFCEYVSRNGLSEDLLEISLKALGNFTRFFSAEFDIRHFLNKFPEYTLQYIKLLSESNNIHQRRLASEGTRPSLPWAKKINIDYKQTANILNNLYYDKERYVTRSVANHLNDISKIDIDFVLNLLDKWRKSKKQNEKEMNYIINHSLRTAIKRGDKKAFDFIGFSDQLQCEIGEFKIIQPKISLNQYLEFEFYIYAKKDTNLIIDYIIEYAHPKKKSQKVFKIKQISLKKDEKIKIQKRHLFKTMTTKKLYEGMHKIYIQINGRKFDLENEDFELKLM